MNEYRSEHLQAILERLKLMRVPERLDHLARSSCQRELDLCGVSGSGAGRSK
jgi:hypothetical protein